MNMDEASDWFSLVFSSSLQSLTLLVGWHEWRTTAKNLCHFLPKCSSPEQVNEDVIWKTAVNIEVGGWVCSIMKMRQTKDLIDSSPTRYVNAPRWQTCRKSPAGPATGYRDRTDKHTTACGLRKALTNTTQHVARRLDALLQLQQLRLGHGWASHSLPSVSICSAGSCSKLTPASRINSGRLKHGTIQLMDYCVMTSLICAVRFTS